jgi:hypothetical protein
LTRLKFGAKLRKIFQTEQIICNIFYKRVEISDLFLLKSGFSKGKRGGKSGERETNGVQITPKWLYWYFMY